MDLDHNYFLNGILPDLNYRFSLASAGSIAEEIGLRNSSSEQVTALVGEAILGAFFLSLHNTKSINRTIGLHLEGNGPAERVIGFAGSDGGVRGHSSQPHATWDGLSETGKGSGIMMVNVFENYGEKVYQSAIDMRAVPLNQNIEEYSGKSDQIQHFCKIQSRFDTERSELYGYSFIALPGATADQTDRLLNILQNKEPSELFMSEKQAGQALKTGPFESIQTMKSGFFFFRCECNRKKVESLLVSLGRSSVEDIIETEGNVEITCEFCHKQYVFDRTDVSFLFKE